MKGKETIKEWNSLEAGQLDNHGYMMVGLETEVLNVLNVFLFLILIGEERSEDLAGEGEAAWRKPWAKEST